MKSVLPFEKLPKGLPLNKKILYCVVDISGIQSFIFDKIDRFTTIDQIRARSQFVENITRYIHNQLSLMSGYLFGTVSSGKLLCGFAPSAKETEIAKHLSALQRSLFASTKGKLTFYFALTTAFCIKKDRFNSTKMQHVNAVLSHSLEIEKFHCLNLLTVDMQKEARKELTPQITSQKQNSVSTDQVIAKLDLDNLGAFFRDITAFDHRDKVSRDLNEIILNCLKADTRIKTIFAGGDDIFFRCPFSDYLPIISKFYSRLKDQLADNPRTYGYAENFFGISAGICVLRNQLDHNIPLLSYYEVSENALSNAKTTGGKNCLCIEVLKNYLLYCDWDDFIFLSKIYARLKKPLFEQHNFSGTELVNINKLAELLSRIGKSENKLSWKEQNRLHEIRIKSTRTDSDAR